MNDPIEVLQYQIQRRKKHETQFHIHPTGRRGASQIGACNLKDSWKLSNRKMPQRIGIKSETGAMDVGNIYHDTVVQPLLREYYNSHEYKELYPGEIYGEEIYVEVKMTDNTTVITPIDIGFVSPPGFIFKEVEFKNIIASLPFKHPDSIWLRAYDIKSASDLFAFWHYKQEEELIENYKAQMHLELMATGLTFIDVLFVNKASFKMFYKRCVFEDDYWDYLVERIVRKEWLTEMLNKSTEGAIPLLNKSDLGYFCNDDEIECRYCGLSMCHDEETQNGKGKLVMDMPCQSAAAFIREDALELFKVGQLWKRGKSHVTIQDIIADVIISKNKSGTVYEDSIYSAYKTFEAFE